MKNLIVAFMLLAPLASQASILKYVHCQYGPDSQNLNSLDMDLNGQKLSTMELDANGWNSPIAKLGSAFEGEISGAATSATLSVNYSDSTENTVKIEADGNSYKWRGTIDIHIPSPRADEYQPGTSLEKLLEGHFSIECYREVDNEG